MRDYIDIGPTPAGESCQQLGSPTYDPAIARMECQVYIWQLRREFNIVDGVYLSIKRNSHDFGEYLSVCVWYKDDDEAATEQAFAIESTASTAWTDEAKVELARRIAEYKSQQVTHASTD